MALDKDNTHRSRNGPIFQPRNFQSEVISQGLGGVGGGTNTIQCDGNQTASPASWPYVDEDNVAVQTNVQVATCFLLFPCVYGY